MADEMTPQEAEELFVNQAAHLLLALAGIKHLPSPKANHLQIDDVFPPVTRKKSR